MARSDWRRVLITLSISMFIEFSAFNHMAAFMPLYLSGELGMQPQDVSFWTGVLAGLPLAVALPFAPFWGAWAVRYSFKGVMVRAHMFEVLAYLGFVFATDLPHIVIVAVLVGLTYGNVAVLMATVAQATPNHRVGFALSVVQMMGPLGASLGPLFGSWLIPYVGLRGLFIIDICLVAVAACLVWFGIDEPSHPPKTASMFGQVRTTIIQCWRLPAIRWSFITMFFLLAGYSVVQPYIPLILGQYYEGEDLVRSIGYLGAAGGIATLLITPIFGLLGDRFGHERVTIPMMGFTALLHLALALVSGPYWVFGLLLLRYMPQASTMGNLNTSLAVRAPADNRAALMSMAPFPRNLAMFVGPSLAAVAASFSLWLLFPLAAALMGIGVLTSIMLHRISQAAPAEPSLPPVLAGAKEA